MGFADIQFPPTISYGFTAKPVYSTSIIEVDSGAEERVARWSNSRHIFGTDKEFRQSDADAIKAFWEARQGPAYSFRFKDWTDYATSTYGVTHEPEGTAVAFTDLIIGTGDGTTKTFQLIKKYTSGGVTRTRNITLPVSGTVAVGVDDGDGTADAEADATALGWSVNTVTGIVTFTTAPGSGHDIYAGFEFDVPVRFMSDESVELAFVEYDHVIVSGADMIEVKDEGTVTEERFTQGAKNWGNTSADIAIVESDGYSQRFVPTTTGLAIVLPNADTLPGGGPYFQISNAGASPNDLTIENAAGVSAGTITTGNVAELTIEIDSGGNRSWLLWG